MSVRVPIKIVELNQQLNSLNLVGLDFFENLPDNTIVDGQIMELNVRFGNPERLQRPSGFNATQAA